MGLVKALIKCTESPSVEVEAQFNPKELQVDKTVSWTPSSSHGESPVQEFKEPQAASLGVTLYFDTYESKEDVYDKYIKSLEKMVVMDESLGRPPMVIFVWGKFQFKGVVESLGQKYTMFLDSGVRSRCEVAFRMKSASGAKVGARKE